MHLCKPNQRLELSSGDRRTVGSLMILAQVQIKLLNRATYNYIAIAEQGYDIIQLI